MRRALVGVALLGLVVAVPMGRAEVTITPLGGDSPAAGALPTMKEVEGEFEDARYSVCIQKIGRMLGGESALSAEDRYTLLSLKGECLIRQKQAGMAAEAFGAAAQAATEKTEIATATATSALLRHSENFAYTPVTGKEHKPLPISDKAKRGPAMAAIFADELTRSKPLYQATVASTDLQPTVDFGVPFRGLAMLELAATGGTVQMDPVQKALLDHAHELVAGEVAKMNAAGDAIVASATSMVEIPGVDYRPARKQRKGLTDADRQKINDLTAEADKLEGTAKQVAGAYGVGADFFKDDVAALEALKKRLHAMTTGVFRTSKMPAPRTVGSR